MAKAKMAGETIEGDDPVPTSDSIASLFRKRLGGAIRRFERRAFQNAREDLAKVTGEGVGVEEMLRQYEEDIIDADSRPEAGDESDDEEELREEFGNVEVEVEGVTSADEEDEARGIR
jgi:hypothetical protein